MRIAVVLSVALLAMPAHAASPEVEAAIKTIRAVAADLNLRKTFWRCWQSMMIKIIRTLRTSKLRLTPTSNSLEANSSQHGTSWRASMKILPTVRRFAQCSTNSMTNAASDVRRFGTKIGGRWPSRLVATAAEGGDGKYKKQNCGRLVFQLHKLILRTSKRPPSASCAA